MDRTRALLAPRTDQCIAGQVNEKVERCSAVGGDIKIGGTLADEDTNGDASGLNGAVSSASVFPRVGRVHLYQASRN